MRSMAIVLCTSFWLISQLVHGQTFRSIDLKTNKVSEIHQYKLDSSGAEEMESIQLVDTNGRIVQEHWKFPIDSNKGSFIQYDSLGRRIEYRSIFDEEQWGIDRYTYWGDTLVVHTKRFVYTKQEVNDSSWCETRISRNGKKEITDCFTQDGPLDHGVHKIRGNRHSNKVINQKGRCFYRTKSNRHRAKIIRKGRREDKVYYRHITILNFDKEKRTTSQVNRSRRHHWQIWSNVQSRTNYFYGPDGLLSKKQYLRWYHAGAKSRRADRKKRGPRSFRKAFPSEELEKKEVKSSWSYYRYIKRE